MFSIADIDGGAGFTSYFMVVIKKICIYEKRMFVSATRYRNRLGGNGGKTVIMPILTLLRQHNVSLNLMDMGLCFGWIIGSTRTSLIYACYWHKTFYLFYNKISLI